MSIKNIPIKIKYQSFVDDPITDFYIPVLEESISYKRAVGYFSSTILIDYVRGLRNFLSSGGKMQLIISPYLSKSDISAIELINLEDMTKELTNSLFLSFLSDQAAFTSAKLLFILIKMDMLEIKVAEPKKTTGLFHDKIGIFEDSDKNKVAITGSNNETSASVRSNIESFNTFCSWKIGQEEYVNQHATDFDNYWNGNNPLIKIYPLNQALDLKIINEFETDEKYEDLVKLLYDDITDEENNWSVIPYEFQLNAVKEWFKVRQGIFKFATGSGKTKTAIYLMERLEKEKSKNFFIIVVPDKTLVNQWSDELDLYNKRVIRCFSENNNWQIKLKDYIEISKIMDQYNYYVVVTNDSYVTERFQRELSKIGRNYLLVIDECHTWGTEAMLNNLPEPSMRLGLSATPEIFYSKIKTDKLMKFFGGIVAEYSLEDAIRDEKLVPYKYFPHFVKFSDEEKTKYNDLTKKIVRLIGYDIDDMSDKFAQFGGLLEILLFSRARIVYGAEDKINNLKNIVVDIANQKNLIIYCGPTSYLNENSNLTEKDSLTQLEMVNKLLGQLDLKFAQYTSKETEAERKNALQAFTSGDFSTLVAIKCLDEGVNIPQIERAIIMASSTNPREFVQRRGRILRTYPGKTHSEIHDFVVFDQNFPLLNKKEIARVVEFSKLAINKDELVNNLNHEQKKIYMEVLNNGK